MVPEPPASRGLPILLSSPSGALFGRPAVLVYSCSAPDSQSTFLTIRGIDPKLIRWISFDPFRTLLDP